MAGPRKPPLVQATSGATKAAVLNHFERVGLSRFTLCPGTKLGWPPVPGTFRPVVTVEYGPVFAVKIVDSFQFPAIICVTFDENLGLLTTLLRLNCCRMS